MIYLHSCSLYLLFIEQIKHACSFYCTLTPKYYELMSWRWGLRASGTGLGSTQLHPIFIYTTSVPISEGKKEVKRKFSLICEWQYIFSVSPAHLQGPLHQNYPHTHIRFGTGFTPDVLPDVLTLDQFGMSNPPYLNPKHPEEILTWGKHANSTQRTLGSSWAQTKDLLLCAAYEWQYSNS